MATAQEVAEWMLQQLKPGSYLSQDTAVYQINKKFGKDFVYDNENGNLAIGKDVLKAFRKLTDGKVVWERGEKSWRMIRSNESYKGRQVD